MGWKEDFIERIQKARNNASKLGSVKYPTQHSSLTVTGTGVKGDRGPTGPRGLSIIGPTGPTGIGLQGEIQEYLVLRDQKVRLDQLL
jgi:hypothetical protein